MSYGGSQVGYEEARAMAEAASVVEDLHKRFGDLEVLRGVSLTAHEHDGK